MTDRAPPDTDKAKLAPGCAFWVLWVLASTLGWTIGFPVADAILRALGEVVADEIVIYALLGALPGILQWPLLRLYVPRASRWILASALSGLLLGVAASTVGNIVDPPVGFVMAGILFGALQWLVLRLHSAFAWWWLLASPAGWAAGYLVVRAADGVVSALPLSETMGFTLLFGMFGAVYGLVTGVVMAALMQGPALAAHYHLAYSAEGQDE